MKFSIEYVFGADSEGPFSLVEVIEAEDKEDATRIAGQRLDSKRFHFEDATCRRLVITEKVLFCNISQRRER